jgi:hypothetical protein
MTASPPAGPEPASGTDPRRAADPAHDRNVEPGPTVERGHWATNRAHLEVGPVTGADARSVHGRRLSGPIQGFGRLWQKTYSVRLDGVDVEPEQVVAAWRAHYGEFWPDGNRFTAPLAGVEPGEVALISGRAGGLTLSTGVLVLYADDVSFSFLTPEGHPFAGMITFSASAEQRVTIAQAQLLIRAHDPLVELGMALGGHRKEDRIWQHTLGRLAAHFGVDAPVETQVVCVDRRRQWRRIGNVRHDAVLRAVAEPLRRRDRNGPGTSGA